MITASPSRVEFSWAASQPFLFDGFEMTIKHTPGPWTIEWYECRADRGDVKAGTAKKAGDVLWRVPMQIGPVSADENHWARLHLNVSEEDARLIAAAPDLFDALQAALDDHNGIDTNINWQKAARAAIAKATQ